MPQKLDKSPRGAYDAIVFIDGSEVVAEDADGRRIASGTAGTDDVAVLQAAHDSGSRYYGGTISLDGIFNLADVPWIIRNNFTKVRGSANTIIKQNSANVDAIQFTPIVGQSAIEFVGMEDVRVETVAGSGDAINTYRLCRSCLKNIHIPGAGRYGLRLNSSLLNEIDSLWVSPDLAQGLSGCGTACVNIHRENTSDWASNANVFVAPTLEQSQYGLLIDDQRNDAGTNEGFNLVLGGTIESQTVEGISATRTDGLQIYQTDLEGRGITLSYCHWAALSPVHMDALVASNCQGVKFFNGKLDNGITLTSCNNSLFENIRNGGGLDLNGCNTTRFLNYVTYGSTLVRSNNVLTEFLNGVFAALAPSDYAYDTAYQRMSFGDNSWWGGEPGWNDVLNNRDMNPSDSALPNGFVQNGSPTLETCGIGHADTTKYKKGHSLKITKSDAHDGVYVPINGHFTEEKIVVKFRTSAISGSAPLILVTDSDFNPLISKSCVAASASTAWAKNDYMFTVPAGYSTLWILFSGANGQVASFYLTDVVVGRYDTIATSSGSSTGTSSEQTIAHSLAAIPTGCKAWIKYLVGTRYVTEMIPFDATNVYPNVTAGVAYEWRIE